MDLAAHLRDQVLHDRHAKPRAGDLLGGKTGLSGIGFKQMRKEFLRHAKPRIPDDELIFRASHAVKLLHLQRDLIPFGREFERVGKKVVQDLAEAEAVSQDPHVPDVHLHRKLFSLLLRLQTEGRRDVRDAFFQIEFLMIQHHLPLLQPGHLKDIVDQLQKLLSGKADLLQIILRFLRIFDMRKRQVRQADDRV